MRFIAALALLLGAEVSGAQQPDAGDVAEAAVRPPIVIDSESSESDLRSGITRFSDNVTISRGPMLVFADEGVVRQVDGEITEIELTGSPTEWRDTLEDGTVVTGEAANIRFDVVENVVTLTGSARLQHEQGRYTGDELVYDLDTESLAGRGTEGNRVRVVIEPEALDGESDPTAPGDEANEAPEDEEADDPADDGDTGEAPEQASEPDDPRAG
jgi:lipopolysaccharide export system protein LptA